MSDTKRLKSYVETTRDQSAYRTVDELPPNLVDALQLRSRADLLTPTSSVATDAGTTRRTSHSRRRPSRTTTRGATGRSSSPRCAASASPCASTTSGTTTPRRSSRLACRCPTSRSGSPTPTRRGSSPSTTTSWKDRASDWLTGWQPSTQRLRCGGSADARNRTSVRPEPNAPVWASGEIVDSGRLYCSYSIRVRIGQ